MSLSDRVLLAEPESYNSGLTVPSSSWMVSMLGKPGPLATDCAPPFAAFEEHLVTKSVGPFRVTGHKAAVLSLTHIFEDVKAAGRQDLLDEAKTAGMLCVRKIRGSTGYSNHSFGMAIDMFFGADVEPFGSKFTQQGMLDLYPFFHARQWYYGGGYKTATRKDGMHFEASKELVLVWKDMGLL